MIELNHLGSTLNYTLGPWLCECVQCSVSHSLGGSLVPTWAQWTLCLFSQCGGGPAVCVCVIRKSLPPPPPPPPFKEATGEHTQIAGHSTSRSIHLIHPSTHPFVHVQTNEHILFNFCLLCPLWPQWYSRGETILYRASKQALGSFCFSLCSVPSVFVCVVSVGVGNFLIPPWPVRYGTAITALSGMMMVGPKQPDSAEISHLILFVLYGCVCCLPAMSFRVEQLLIIFITGPATIGQTQLANRFVACVPCSAVHMHTHTHTFRNLCRPCYSNSMFQNGMAGLWSIVYLFHIWRLSFAAIAIMIMMRVCLATVLHGFVTTTTRQ